MSKILLLKVPNDFDMGKMIAVINAAEDFRIIDDPARVKVLDAVQANGAKRRNVTSRVGRKADQSVVSSVMGHFTPRAEFTTLQAQAWVKEAGYNLTSASPALTALKQGGFIEQVAPGRYRFLRPLAAGTKPKDMHAR